MKVLCVLNQLPLTGQGNHKEGLYPVAIKCHAKAGYDTDVLVIKGGSNEELKDACRNLGARYLSGNGRDAHSTLGFIKYLGESLNPVWLRLAYQNRRLLIKIAQDFKIHGYPDLIIALTSCEQSGILAKLIHNRFKIPFVVWEHRTHYARGMLRGVRKSVCKKVIQSADLLFTVSPQLRDNIERALEVDVDNTAVLPNPVEDIFFSKPDSLTWVDQFAQGRFIFAGWTNWRPIKRLDLLLKAFADVNYKEPQTCLIIAGPVKNSEQMISIIEKEGLEHSVKLAGPLKRKDIHALAHQVDCCVVPSDHETFGLPIVEAMAAGKPSVATKCGGPESIVNSSSLGRLVNKGDYEVLAEAMLDIYNNKEHFVPEYIQQQCKKRYSEEAFSRQLVRAYSMLQSNVIL